MHASCRQLIVHKVDTGCRRTTSDDAVATAIESTLISYNLLPLRPLLLNYITIERLLSRREHKSSNQQIAVSKHCFPHRRLVVSSYFRSSVCAWFIFTSSRNSHRSLQFIVLVRSLSSRVWRVLRKLVVTIRLFYCTAHFHVMVLGASTPQPSRRPRWHRQSLSSSLPHYNFCPIDFVS